MKTLIKYIAFINFTFMQLQSQALDFTHQSRTQADIQSLEVNACLEIDEILQHLQYVLVNGHNSPSTVNLFNNNSILDLSSLSLESDHFGVETFSFEEAIINSSVSFNNLKNKRVTAYNGLFYIVGLKEEGSGHKLVILSSDNGKEFNVHEVPVKDDFSSITTDISIVDNILLIGTDKGLYYLENPTEGMSAYQVGEYSGHINSLVSSYNVATGTTGRILGNGQAYFAFGTSDAGIRLYSINKNDETDMFKMRQYIPGIGQLGGGQFSTQTLKVLDLFSGHRMLIYGFGYGTNHTHQSQVHPFNSVTGTPTQAYLMGAITTRNFIYLDRGQVSTAGSVIWHYHSGQGAALEKVLIEDHIRKIKRYHDDESFIGSVEGEYKFVTFNTNTNEQDPLYFNELHGLKFPVVDFVSKQGQLLVIDNNKAYYSGSKHHEMTHQFELSECRESKRDPDSVETTGDSKNLRIPSDAAISTAPECETSCKVKILVDPKNPSASKVSFSWKNKTNNTISIDRDRDRQAQIEQVHECLLSLINNYESLEGDRNSPLCIAGNLREDHQKERTDFSVSDILGRVSEEIP